MARRRPQQSAEDIINLSMLLKFLGIGLVPIGLFLVLLYEARVPSLFLILLYDKLGDTGTYVAQLFLIVLGVICFFTGRAMGKYKSWAWYSAACILVPWFVLSGILGLLYLPIADVVPEPFGSILQAFPLLACLAAVYVEWALLSKGGRQRYNGLAEAMKKIAERPDSLAARVRRGEVGHRRRPAKTKAEQTDAQTETESPPET